MSFFFPLSYRKITRGLTSLGLYIDEGGKHTLVKCLKNGKKITISRHTEVKSENVDSVCKFLLKKDFKEDEILKNLK